MTEEVIEKLKRVNIDSVNDEESIKMNTNFVYNVIWSNTIYAYKNKSRCNYLITYYVIYDSNNKRILPNKNKIYVDVLDVLESSSNGKQLSIKYSDYCEKERKEYVLPILFTQLFDELHNDGFNIGINEYGDLAISMKTIKFEDLVNKSISGELKTKVKKK